MFVTAELSSLWNSVTSCLPTKFYLQRFSLIEISDQQDMLVQFSEHMDPMLPFKNIVTLCNLNSGRHSEYYYFGLQKVSVCVCVCVCMCLISKAYSLSQREITNVYCQYH